MKQLLLAAIMLAAMTAKGQVESGISSPETDTIGRFEAFTFPEYKPRTDTVAAIILYIDTSYAGGAIQWTKGYKYEVGDRRRTFPKLKYLDFYRRPFPSSYWVIDVVISTNQ